MILLLIFAFGAVSHADKLDRTYLPPPGSKYAGGSPDAILPPIELPKGSSYSTATPTSQGTEFQVFQPAGTYQQGISDYGRPGLHQEDINKSVNFATQAPTRFGSSENSDQFSQVPINQPGFVRSQGPTTSLPPSVYRNGYPTTSTSYAFAQTTTYSPVEEQRCVGQNCAYTPSEPGLVDSGIEPQISISQHAPEHIANIPNNQFGSTERPLQIQQQGYPQQFQYTSSSQAPTNLLTQPGIQTQYSNQNSQNVPTTILPQHNLGTDDGSPLNTPQSNFPSNQGPRTPQQHNIGYQPSFPGQFLDNFQTHSASPQHSTTDVQKVNQQLNPSFTSIGQPGYFDQTDQLSGDRTQNRFDATRPQASLPKSHITTQSTGFRPSNSLDPRLNDAVYASSTPFPVTSISSSSSFESGNIPSNNAVSAESIRPMTSHPLNNHIGISPTSHRLNDEFDRKAYIVNYENVITPEGFAYSYDTSNGIHADENGTAYDGVKAQGSYSYTGDDGKIYTIVYTADENGFQPRGDHLPTPPPIPEAILRVIEEANRSKAAGIVDDGMYDEEKYGYQKYEGAMERLKSHHMNKPKTLKQRTEINDKTMPTYDENVSVEEEEDFGNIQDPKFHNVNDFTRGKISKRPTSVRRGQISQDQDYINENKPKYYSTGKGKLTGSINDDNDIIESNLPSDTSNISDQKSYDYDSNPIQGSKLGKVQHKSITENNAPRGSGRKPVNPSKISKTQNAQSKPIYDDADSNTFDSEQVQQGNDNQYTTRQPIGYVSTDRSFVGGQTRRPTKVSNRRPSIVNQKGSVQRDYIEHVPERANDYQSNRDDNNHDINLNIPGNGGQIKYESNRMQKYPGIHVSKTTNNYEFDSNVQASTGKPSIRIQDYDEKSNGYKYLPPSNKLDQLSSTILPTGAPVTTLKQFDAKTGSTRRPYTTPGLTRSEVDNEDDIDFDKHVTSTTKRPYSKYNKQNNVVPQEQIKEENTTEDEEDLTNIGVNSNKPYNTKPDSDYENRKSVYNLRPQFPMKFQTNYPEQNAVSSTTKPVYYTSSAPIKRVNYYPSDALNHVTRGPDYQPSTTYRPQDRSHSFAPNYAQSTETPYRQFDISVRPGSPINNRITQGTPYPQYSTTQSGNISDFPDHHSTIPGNGIEYTGQYDSSRGPQPSNLLNSDTKFKTQDNTKKPETFDNRLNLGGSKSETRGQFGTTQTPEFGSRITKPYLVQTDATPSSRVTPTIQNYGSPSTSGFGNIENKNMYLPGLPSNSYDRPASSHTGIKGEDFSGPKQQPKFDPETGYHY